MLTVYLAALAFGLVFWLAALPALCGATLRIFYAFAVTVVGGRVWTTLSTASLLLPALGILRSAAHHPLRRNALMIFAHVVWGGFLGWIVQALTKPTNHYWN